MGFILTEENEIRHFATRAALSRTLLEKRFHGIQNACIAVGDGLLGVFNNKSGRFYIQFDVNSPDGTPSSAADIVESFNLLSLAKVSKVDLVGVKVA